MPSITATRLQEYCFDTGLRWMEFLDAMDITDCCDELEVPHPTAMEVSALLSRVNCRLLGSFIGNAFETPEWSVKDRAIAIDGYHAAFKTVMETEGIL